MGRSIVVGFRGWLRQQWERSNIISGILALAIWGVILYLAVVGVEPPDVLIGAGGIIIGFFFKATSG